MKINVDNSFEYRGWVLERLKAQSKNFKELAEEILGEEVSNIYAIGGVVGDGPFDETSDVDILIELTEDCVVDLDLVDTLQEEIEYIENEIGFIQITVQHGLSRNKKIAI